MTTIHAQDDYTESVSAARLALIPATQAACRRIVEDEEGGQRAVDFAAGIDAALSWLDADATDAGFLIHGLKTRAVEPAPPPEAGTVYLIRSTEETMGDGTPCFWDHARSEWGWMEHATVWSSDVAERNDSNLPVTGEWVPFNLTPA